MIFKNPNYAWFLLSLPALIAVMIIGLRSKETKLRQFINPLMWPKVVPSFDRMALIRKHVLVLIAIGLIIFAAMRPQYGTEFKVSKRQGLDIVMAFDTSLSMMAEDISPNRFRRMKKEAITLIELLTNDRIGLVVFSGDAFIQSPLTLDHSALRLFIQDLHIGMISKSGTNLAAALETSIDALKETPKDHRIVLLFTDGENLNQPMERAIKRAQKNNVKIIPIGLGTPSGEPIPIRNDKGVILQYKRDRQNKTVLSKLDEKTLINLATKTGGSYFNTSKAPISAPTIYKVVSQLEKRDVEADIKKHTKDRYHIFLAAAFLILLMEFLLSARKPKAKRLSMLLIAVVGWGMMETPTYALWSEAYYHNEKGIKRLAQSDTTTAENQFAQALSELPDSGPIYYNLGNTFFEKGQYDKAIDAYTQALGRLEKRDRSDAFYNIGNSFAKKGKLDKAIDHYKNALRATPDHGQAKHNLEWAMIQKKIQESKKDDSDSQTPSQNAKEKQPKKEAQSEADKNATMEKEQTEQVLQYLEDQEQKARNEYFEKKMEKKRWLRDDW
ncbi:VWA domain-containing protein [bacterium]|jgi:Ca-activated chloride channel homolog|nr:VWA domain-containing protein [bacterium]